MEVTMATATPRAEMEGDASPTPRSDGDPVGRQTEATPVRSSIDVVLQMLSSDGGGDGEDDDDAATTMGSPVPAAQTLEPVSPLSPEMAPQDSVVSTAGGGAWVQRRPLGAAALPLPSRPKRIDDSSHSDALAPRQPLREIALRAPSRPKRIDDIFASAASAACFAGDSQEEKEEEEIQPSPCVAEARPPELLLSPASQLHILSQISEMAESRAARERLANATACATQPAQVARPQHAWAPIAQHAQTQPHLPPQKKDTPKRKQPAAKAPAAKKSRTGNTLVSAGLLADVATWGAFDERILEGDDAEEDAWSFEELSDSDF